MHRDSSYLHVDLSGRVLNAHLDGVVVDVTTGVVDQLRKEGELSGGVSAVAEVSAHVEHDGTVVVQHLAVKLDHLQDKALDIFFQYTPRKGRVLKKYILLKRVCLSWFFLKQCSIIIFYFLHLDTM